MGCNFPAPSALPCYPSTFPYTEAQVTPYVVNGDTNCIDMIAVLMVNRLIYYKTSSNCGSCAGENSIPGINATQIATAGVGATGAGFGIAAGIGGVGSSAAAAAATASIFLAPIGIGLGIYSAIAAHHAAAVQKEQSTICSVVNAWNGFADQIEPAIRAGKIPLQDAIVALQNLHDRLVDVLMSIYKKCNASCVYRWALESIFNFNKNFVYPSLVPAPPPIPAPMANPVSAPTASSTPGQVQQSQPAQAAQAGLPGGSLALIGIGVGAKLAGVY